MLLGLGLLNLCMRQGGNLKKDTEKRWLKKSSYGEDWQKHDLWLKITEKTLLKKNSFITYRQKLPSFTFINYNKYLSYRDKHP